MPASSDADPSTTAAAPIVDTCHAPTFEVDHPAAWHTNDGEEGPPCRWFHPSGFELPEASEATAVAISIRYADLSLVELEQIGRAHV